MSGGSTLIVTTRTGVRPLGVRGEPLHNAAGPLRAAVRRRLGDAAADLLADPQLHEDGKAIDWYAGWNGEVRRVADLDPARRGEILALVDSQLADIARLGATLIAASPGEESGLIGRSLLLAARKPAESFVFLVGEQPVIVCWGYEREAAAGLIGPAAARVPARRSVLDAPAPMRATPALPAIIVPQAIPWFRTLLAALPLLVLLLGAAWLLRELIPSDPDLTMATREGPSDPSAAEPPPDPMPAMKASLSSEEARAKALRLELAVIEGELRKRVVACKPPEKEPARPPQVATAQPPPRVVPPPQPPPPPPPPRPQRPPDGRMRMPAGPTNDFSFMQGCWRTDPFRHERTQAQPGVSSYCFDANGNGSMEWRRGRTACRTRARAQFYGPDLALRDADTTCNDGSRWYSDQLTCRRGADNVAYCDGRSRGAFGPTSWTVNLHRID